MGIVSKNRINQKKLLKPSGVNHSFFFVYLTKVIDPFLEKLPTSGSNISAK